MQVTLQSTRYWLFIAFLVVVFLTGGGASSEVQSLLILRPLAALFLGFGIYTLTIPVAQTYRGLLWFSAVILLLVVVQLIPLPPEIWSRLPGRGIVSDIDRIAALGRVWRPITMAPAAGWNALFSLIVPLAALCNAIQLDQRERRTLPMVLIVIGVVAILLAVLQVLGGPGNAFYLYRVTNDGSTVGLFANRNHFATFLLCLLPLVATEFSSDRWRTRMRSMNGIVFIASCTTVVAFIIASGSRAALLLAPISVIASWLIFRRGAAATKRAMVVNRSGKLTWLGGGVALCVLIAVFALRGQVLDRLALVGSTDDMRAQVWGPIFRDVWQYFPIGSGVGSFVPVFQLIEPGDLLEASYLNHAHNDLLEVALTTGVPGLLVVLFAAIALIRATIRIWREPAGAAMKSLGACVLATLFLASLADYPLRTPSLSVLAVLAGVWLYARNDRDTSSRSDGTKRIPASFPTP